MDLAITNSAGAAGIDDCDHTNVVIKDCSSGQVLQGYLNAEIIFPDNSHWKCTKALSNTKYQQGQPPFEATQVYECMCVKDPNNLHGEGKEAVIKAKYQVQGTPESFAFFYSYEQTQRIQLSREEKAKGNQEKLVKATKDFEEAKELLRQATQPVDMAHHYTMQEIQALIYLKRVDCKHTPHFIEADGATVDEDIDEMAMAGGYSVFMLMTKLPGERIEYSMFWSKTFEERQEIREAFKAALFAVWKCKLAPQDWSMRNLIWNKDERMCYIVDFEDYTLLTDNTDSKLEEMWDDGYYRAWGIAEECWCPE